MATKITIDASGNQVVFNSPGHSASETNNPSDAPAPSRGGSQATVRVIGTPGSAVRFSNPS